MLSLHAFELVLPRLHPSLASTLLARYPDLFPVLNVLLNAPVLGLIWLWSLKRQLEVGWALGLGGWGVLSGGAGAGKKKKKGKRSADVVKGKEVESAKSK